MSQNTKKIKFYLVTVENRMYLDQADRNNIDNSNVKSILTDLRINYLFFKRTICLTILTY